MRVNPGSASVPEVLAAQFRHQLRLHNQRMMWWICWIFVVGLGVAIVGLIPAIAMALERGSPTPGLFVFAFFVALFGWAVVLWLTSPLAIKPRIVPYFARELAPFGGATTVAFRRGRRLYLEMGALERLAGSLGVRPLSDFGFAYDHFDQEMRWHPAAEGLKTIEALKGGLEGVRRTAPGLADDLDALDATVRAAAERGIEFSLVMRLYAKDSLQSMSLETGQGSFW